MSMKVVTDTKIYVLCPSSIVTGGPESLHQLVHELREQGRNAFIVYSADAHVSTAKEYEHYDTPKAETVEDDEDNILIVPEIWASKLIGYNHIQKAIWWLSVDNYLKWDGHFDFKSSDRLGIRHFAHSYYAERFLSKKGVRWVWQLSTSVSGIHGNMDQKKYEKNDRVLYNAKKCGPITRRIMNASKDLHWTSLGNMSQSEVASLMQTSKVYVDFGPFPGKERMPREAVLNGCCVITGNRGASRYFEDVPIAQEYKFNITPLWRFKKFSMTEAIVRKIRQCLSQYDDRIKDFNTYRQRVASGEVIFKGQVRSLFSMAFDLDEIIHEYKKKVPVNI